MKPDDRQAETVTAAVLVIGDEILSGRTKDSNLGYIAEYLARIGVDVREARVVPDIEEEIVAALNALRHRYDYVFTTGGIGPTHDDITADSVAKAFGVEIDEDPRIIEMMLQRYKPGELTPARRRMARVPDGGELVDNPVSKAAGLQDRQRHRHGRRAFRHAGDARSRRDDDPHRLADAGGDDRRRRRARKGAMATNSANSPPHGPTSSSAPIRRYQDGKFRNQIVVRSKDEAEVAEARAAVEAMLGEDPRRRRSRPDRGEGRPVAAVADP